MSVGDEPLGRRAERQDEPLGRRASNSDLDELLAILDLNQIADDTFVGSHPSKNPVRTFGGQMMIHALVRLDESNAPTHVDYYNLDRASEGSIQLGIMKWVDDEVCFCMGPPNGPRPGDFTCPAGSGRTFSQWRRKN